MRPCLIATALVLLGASTIAQTPAVNQFHVYSNRTSFTSRGFLSGNAGETLQGYPAERYRGVGDNGTVPKAASVFALGMLTQDQNRATVEKYAVIFRRVDDMGMAPDGSEGGIIAKTSKLSLPTAAGTGPVAWSITVNLGEEGVAVPSHHTYFAGLALDANPEWTADGQSTHASAYTDPANTAGDPVREGALNHAWQVDEKGEVRETNPRSWNYNLQTRRGVFQIGVLQTATSTTGLYGNCGNYPDAKTHGLSFRIRDKDMAGKVAALFGSTALISGAPIAVDGLLWINPGTFFMVDSGTLSSTGELELTPAAFAPGKLAGLVGFGDLAFQGAILDIGQGRFNLRMTNAQATNL